MNSYIFNPGIRTPILINNTMKMHLNHPLKVFPSLLSPFFDIHTDCSKKIN